MIDFFFVFAMKNVDHSYIIFQHSLLAREVVFHSLKIILPDQSIGLTTHSLRKRTQSKFLSLKLIIRKDK